jgi:hypothetical protein
MDRAVARQLATGVTMTGVAGVALAGFLPWLRSGRVVRDSFEVVRIADELDVAAGVPQDLAIAVWYVLPLLCASAVLACVVHRPALTAVAALAAGLVAFVAGALTVRSPFAAQVGAWVAMATGAIACVGAVALLVVDRTAAPIGAPRPE